MVTVREWALYRRMEISGPYPMLPPSALHSLTQSYSEMEVSILLTIHWQVAKLSVSEDSKFGLHIGE